jgi:hypothetical protein
MISERFAPIVALSLASAACSSSTPATDGGATGGPDGSDAMGADSGAFQDPYDGASGCTEAGTPPAGMHACELFMPVSGGISGTLADATGFGCTSTNGPEPATMPLSFGVRVSGPQPWMDVVAIFNPPNPIVPGQTGPLPSTTVALVAGGVDGGSLSWVTPPTCVLDIASNACTGQGTLYVISGTGHCADAAAAYHGNTEPPVTIGDFSFAGEYDSSVPGDQ